MSLVPGQEYDPIFFEATEVNILVVHLRFGRLEAPVPVADIVIYLGLRGETRA